MRNNGPRVRKVRPHGNAEESEEEADFCIVQVVGLLIFHHLVVHVLIDAKIFVSKHNSVQFVLLLQAEINH